MSCDSSPTSGIFEGSIRMVGMCLLLLLFPILPSCLAPGTSPSGPSDPDQAKVDFQEILALHEKDMKAAKEGSVEDLASLWTDDGVALPAGEQPIVGIDAIRSSMMESHGQLEELEVVSYDLMFEEVTIVQDHAYEWGAFRGTYRPRDGGDLIEARGYLLRILRKDPDKGWRVARSMWTSAK